jgi:hypothetical protein
MHVKKKTQWRHLCEHSECKVIPYFNHFGQTGGRFCKRHSEDGMENVRCNQCERDGCKVIPSFNHFGQTGGRFCKPHSEDGMEDVVNKQCERDCCKRQPKFNHFGQTGGRFCKPHSEDGMEDVVHNQCERDGCKVIPGFNHFGQTGGRFCKRHSEDGMEDVVSNKCETVGCKVQPSFLDKDGKLSKLCEPCAFNAGLRCAPAPGASRQACECWDRIEACTDAKLTNHVHFGPTTHSGSERAGLVEGSRIKPDAFIEPQQPIHLTGQTSGAKGAVYLFHGEEWHGGWPPGHKNAQRDACNHKGVLYSVLYQNTLKQHALYKEAGYRVFCVWGLDFAKTCPLRYPVHILDVVHEV